MISTESAVDVDRVVVVVSGCPADEVLIRRAAAIAQRSATGFTAVHLLPSGASGQLASGSLARTRLIAESAGGRFESVIGEDSARTLVEFVIRVGASELVIGQPDPAGPWASWRRRLSRQLTVDRVLRASSRINCSRPDVHVVPVPGSAAKTVRRPPSGISKHRQLAGLALAAITLPALTALGVSARGQLRLSALMPLYLLAVVVVSMVGGFVPALATALVGFVLMDYYLEIPRHDLRITMPQHLIALVVFLLVAVLVSRVVDLAARRSIAATRASAEAETLSMLAGSLLRGEHALPGLLQRVQASFGARSVSLLQPSAGRWQLLAWAGDDPPVTPDAGDDAVQVGQWRLVLRGRSLAPDERRVLSAFAAEVAAAYRQRQLAQSDRQRITLLNAVSHDLRTPLATAKAAVTSLRAGDVAWSEQQRGELLAAADAGLNRLTDLVTNLLDLSRLQAGALPVLTAPVGLDDVVWQAVDHLGDAATSHVQVEVPADLPEVSADAGLLERVVANLLQNGLRHAPPGTPVTVCGQARSGYVQLRVADRGPGMPPGEDLFAPFHRRDEAASNEAASDEVPSGGAGVGLGLAIARGFTEAMGGVVSSEPTPGGGATLVVTLRPA